MVVAGLSAAPVDEKSHGRRGRVKRPTLATLALSLLALLFGWETRQALQGFPGAQDNAGEGADRGLAARDLRARPAAPLRTRRPWRRPSRRARSFGRTGSRSGSRWLHRAPARNYETELSRFTLLGVFGFGNKQVGVVDREDREARRIVGS